MSIKLTAKQKSKPIYTAADHASRLAFGIYAIIQPILLRENRMRRKLEYFWVLGVDNDRYLKFAELLAHAYGLAGLGGQNRVHIKPADALRMAIYKETDYIIFIHNYPTGKLNPSPEDKDATDRLIKAAEVVDIKVADHFIISETKYYSFAEAGLMKQLRESSTYRVLHEDEVELLKVQMEAAGIAKGKELGKDEKAKEIATKALKQGFTVEQVAKLTGLSKAVVGKMK